MTHLKISESKNATLTSARPVFATEATMQSFLRPLSVLTGLAAAALAGLTFFGAPTRAVAQEPDIREIRPVIMLVVDSSGSNEYLDGTEQAPVCSGTAGAGDDRNRWTTVLEALTGTWDDYYCTRRSRLGYTGAPDQHYRLAYHEPPIGVSQNLDGILDIYSTRVKFGLMTADAFYGLRSYHSTFVPESVFRANLLESRGAGGSYSYGTEQRWTFPGCGVPYMVDAGVRHDGVGIPGRLVSVGTDVDDPVVINQEIQTSLLSVRPAFGTPMDAMLDDVRYYFTNHADVNGSGDSFAECRQRFAIVLSDGEFDDWYRTAAHCDSPGQTCPYQLSTEIAADLCRFDTTLGDSGECTGVLDGLFVVALNPGAPHVGRLNDLALQGGTGSAIIATDRATLVTALSEAISRAAPGSTTRTVPSFGSSSSGFAATAAGAGTQTQFQMTSGFQLSTAGEPWSGVLERTRWTCDADLNPVAQDIDSAQGDRFDETLDARDVVARPRRLLTVVTSTNSEMRGTILGRGASVAPLSGALPAGVPRDLSLTAFHESNAALRAGFLGISGGTAATRTARRLSTIQWIDGRDPSRTHRLGDIYHSSPQISSPPRLDIADESYNRYRGRGDVRDRPSFVFVGTNDGVLHAFASEAYRSDDGTVNVEAGEEVWGFVPPYVMSRLESATTTHQVLVDGTPVIRDVFFARTSSDPLPDEGVGLAARPGGAYRRVLVMGLRGGGSAYVALDVTDPVNPVFLWQYASPTMGATLGRPAIAQVLVRVGGLLQERAVAILPGGAGDIDVGAATYAGPSGCVAGGAGGAPVTDGTTTSRTRGRCWLNQGRELQFVDLATGMVIAGFDHTVFNAPLTGGVAVFTGDTGTIATRGFLTDADGVLWRLDFSSENPADWTARPFHDIFWDMGALAGQPVYEPPVVSIDDQENVVILVATGDVDRLDGTEANRVASLTERVVRSAGGVITVTGELNWEIRLRAGEQVTGPISLFQSNAYFGSFMSNPGSCDYGTSQVWGVHYRNAGSAVIVPPAYTGSPAGRFPAAGLESTPGIGSLDSHYLEVGENQIVMGVAVTQRPTCVQGDAIPDPYLGGRWQVDRSGGGQFELVAQVSGRPTGAAAPGVSPPRVSTITRTLPAPAAYTRFRGVAATADF